MGIEFIQVTAANVMVVIRLYASPNILLWIPNELVTREVCMAAVKANGLALKDVPNIYMTRDICLAAMNQNHQAFWAIPNELVSEFCLKAASSSLLAKCGAAKYVRF